MKTYEDSDLFIETQKIVPEVNENSIKHKSIDASKLQIQEMLDKFNKVMEVVEETKKGLEYVFGDLVPDWGKNYGKWNQKVFDNFQRSN